MAILVVLSLDAIAVVVPGLSAFIGMLLIGVALASSAAGGPRSRSAASSGPCDALRLPLRPRRRRRLRRRALRGGARPGLDRVHGEFPELRLTFLTNPAGAGAPLEGIETRVVGLGGRRAARGPLRLAIEHVLARRAGRDLLHFFDTTGPVLAPSRPFVTTAHDATIAYGYNGPRRLQAAPLPVGSRASAGSRRRLRVRAGEVVRHFGADPERIRVIHWAWARGLDGASPSPPKRAHTCSMSGTSPRTRTCPSSSAPSALPRRPAGWSSPGGRARATTRSRRSWRAPRAEPTSSSGPTPRTRRSRLYRARARSCCRRCTRASASHRSRR